MRLTDDPESISYGYPHTGVINLQKKKKKHMPRRAAPPSGENRKVLLAVLDSLSRPPSRQVPSARTAACQLTHISIE